MSMELSILTPDELFYKGSVKMVICDLPEGKEGFLPGHMPVMKMLAHGEVAITEEAGDVKKCWVAGGHLTVTDSMQIFTPHVEWGHE